MSVERNGIHQNSAGVSTSDDRGSDSPSWLDLFSRNFSRGATSRRGAIDIDPTGDQELRTRSAENRINLATIAKLRAEVDILRKTIAEGGLAMREFNKVVAGAALPFLICVVCGWGWLLFLL